MPESHHDSHERFVPDCPECDAVLDIEMQAHRPPVRAPLTRDEREAMEADRELMRDEFHR